MSERVYDVQHATKPGVQVAQHDQAQMPVEIDALLRQRASKDALIDQARMSALEGFELLSDAARGAIDQLEIPEVPKTDVTRQLLGLAATALVSASGGAIAGWVVGGIAASLAEGAAEQVKKWVGDAVKGAFSSSNADIAKTIQDLRFDFAKAVDVQRLKARRRFVANWPETYAQLASLPEGALKKMRSLSRQENIEATYEQIQRQTFVAWANFLARAMHGSMSHWDHWAEHGSRDAFPLKDAQRPSPQLAAETMVAQNVSANGVGGLMDEQQRPMQEEHYGLLEVFVYGSNARSIRIVDHPGYRMRLDNVGPRARKELRKGGRVRDLALNKLIRVCSTTSGGYKVDPPIPVATVLVTADGYVRSSRGFGLVHFEPQQGPLWDPTGYGECSRLLISGGSNDACYVDKAAMAVNIASVAEAAQDLPLSYLEP